MFTGLIEALGQVVEVVPRRGSKRLGIRSPLPTAELRQGESIAIDGVCLSLVSTAGDRFFVEAVEETCRCTTLGEIRAGSRVHLERALQLGARLGGHLVQGHVDGTATVASRSQRGDDYRLRIGLEPAWSRYVAHKGSVTVQGVSLTVAALDDTSFEVALIPETLRVTTLGDLRPRDRVNVEVDLLARYLDRLLVD